MNRWTSLAVLAVCVLACSDAFAQMLSNRTPPQHRVVHRNTFALRNNPLGLLYEGRFAYRFRLYESESQALRDNFVGIGLAPGGSPAFARVGAYVEFQPATVLGFWAVYEYVGYYGTFNLFQSFPNASSDFSDTTIQARGGLPKDDPLRSYPTSGTQLTVGTNLNLKAGPIVLRSQARLVRPDFKVRAGDSVFYDQFYDLLMPNQGLAVFNDLDLLYQTDFQLMAGLRYHVGVPFYSNEQLPPGSTVKNSVQRLGPFLAYRFKDEDGAAFNQPSLALVVNWYLQHRYRTGADSSAALPYLALAFNVVGDLMPLD
ncbi:hypothetical protein [Vitiosangium sp. GDMCC 1.1324]|uniref:hypothetical protein n=1 Tax=Vitiosangium sp. (strain GDMCC 1.1324) TaxID=2138576 RepID=UPI000D394936|nr:hypothetical protein [Vitiosangium sp. GDMCC 1.1324]PTL81265.1 hypothetical protein DAT35_24425 [Vitiosangium sp. GDMCC 1.1324]